MSHPTFHPYASEGQQQQQHQQQQQQQQPPPPRHLYQTPPAQALPHQQGYQPSPSHLQQQQPHLHQTPPPSMAFQAQQPYHLQQAPPPPLQQQQQQQQLSSIDAANLATHSRSTQDLVHAYTQQPESYAHHLQQQPQQNHPMGPESYGQQSQPASPDTDTAGPSRRSGPRKSGGKRPNQQGSGSEGRGSADPENGTPGPGTPGGKATGRVAKACQPCSSKKRRCDGRQPECSVCLVLGTPCTYNHTGLKRGPPKGFRSGPKESARARLVRSLETTIRDLAAQLGDDEAGNEISRVSRERGLKVIKADPDHKIEPLDRATAKMESGDMSLEDIASAAVSEEGDAEQLLSRKRQRPDEAYDGSRALALDPSLDPALQSLTGGAAQKEGGVAREALDEDVDFLAVNERGDLMHRGSSSGIQLLHRRPHANVVQQVGGGPGPSGLSNMATLESTSPSGNNAPGTGSGRMPSFGAHGPVPLPMASPRPSHGGRNGSATPRSGSRSPDRHNHLPLTNGALAHRDHILNSLSPHGTPRIRGRALPGEAQAHSLTGDRSSSPLKFNNEQHASHLRSHLESATQLQAMPLPDEALPSQEENARLFRFYWQGFHPFWPILFKPVLDQIPVDELPARLEPVLLYSIYCIAACVVPGEQAPASEAEEDAQDDVNLQDLPGAAHSRGSDPAMAEDYYRRAERYLYEGRLRPNVSTIQALFLLSLYSHGSGELSRAWVYSGLATSMAIDLGLHRWPIHRLDLLHESVERETRIRLVWHCYILDKVLAAEMGRPVGMRAKDCDAPLLSETEKDEFELWSDQTDMQTAGFVKDEASPSRYLHAPSCLNWGVRLFMIVERILSEVHSFRRKAALRKQGGSDKILAELDAELRNWKKSLPEHLWLKLETKDGGPLPSFFALHVWHFTATLLLHRPFIPQDEGVPLADVLANDSHKKCTEAANSICDLLEFSSTCIKVDRLSTDLAYCLFTAAVMFVFNARLSDPVISSDARRRFSLCREWLKKLSKTWPTASAHKQLLDGFSMVGDDVARVTEESSAAEGALAIRPALPDSTQASDAQTAEQNLQFSFHGAQASESSKLWEPSNERTEQLSDGPAAHRQSPLQPNTPTILQDGLVPKISTTQSTPQSSPTHLHSAQMPPRASSVHPPEVSSSLARPHNLQPTNSAIAPHARAAAKFAPYSSDRGNFRNENFGVVNQQQQQQQADQRAQFLQYYNSSSGPKPTAPHMGSTSQLTSAPGIFDLEGVFWNETAAVNTPYGMPGPQRAQVSSLPMPGGSHVPQQQQQQQQQSQALSRPEQHQAQHEYLQGQRNTHGYAPAADGLAMLAHVTGAGGSLPMSRPQDAAAAQAQAQTHQNPGQEQTPQGHYGHNAGQEWRGPAPHNQAQAGQMPQQLQGPGHQQQTISQLQAPPQAAYAGRPGQTGTASGNAQAGLSPFGFSLDPGQPAWSDIMSMLELPPAFT